MKLSANSRWGQMFRGLLKGVISAEAATLTYKNVWTATMSSEIKGALNMDITLPDTFVKQQSYVMIVTNSGPGSYSAVITPTDASNVLGFCKLENSTKGYIARDTLNPSTGSTGSGSTCVKASSELSDIRINGGPSLSAQTIDKILSDAGSPAAGSGQYFVKYGVQYGIDPAFALAFFRQESGYGKAGVAVKTKGIGNIVYTDIALPDSKYNTDRAWSAYDNYENSIKGWYNYITNSSHYLKDGKYTLEQIIPIYAPAGDGGNSPVAYINNVKNYVNQYRTKETGYGVACADSNSGPIASSGLSSDKLGPELSKYLMLNSGAAPLGGIALNSTYYDGDLVKGNYSNTRKAFGFVVLHDGAGWESCGSNESCAAKAVLTMWKSAGLNVSSHYFVGCDGTIFNFVPESQVANHAGCSSSDSTCIFSSINAYSIGLDIRDCTFKHTGKPYTSEQHVAIKNLLANLKSRNILKEVSDKTVVAHFELNGNKNDPLPGFDWAAIGLSDHRLARGNTPFIAALRTPSTTETA